MPPSYAPWAGSGDNAKGILIEPWKIWGEAYMVNPGAGREEQIDHFVDGLVATMIHEISHNTAIGGHDVGFAGLITRVPQYLGSRMHQAITKDLRKRVAAIWDTLSDDLANDAATFRDAARDAGLESYGIESGAARAGHPDFQRHLEVQFRFLIKAAQAQGDEQAVQQYLQERGAGGCTSNWARRTQWRDTGGRGHPDPAAEPGRHQAHQAQIAAANKDWLQMDLWASV